MSDSTPDVARIRQMSPSEFVKLVGRPCPAWLNIDPLIDADEIAEIELIRGEMRALLREAVPLAERFRWALALGNRFECEADDAHTTFYSAIGTDELLDLGTLLGQLFTSDGMVEMESFAALAAKYGDSLPDVVAAAERFRAERPNTAPERGTFETPRDAAAGPDGVSR